MRSPVRTAALLVLSVVLLAGCTSPAPSAEPTRSAVAPSPTEPSPTDVSPAPAPTATTVPTATLPETCDALIPLSVVTDALDDGWVETDELRDPQTTLPGPAARAAADDALESVSCQWFPSGTEGYLAAYAFRLDDSVRTDLLEGLRGASSYTSVDIEGAEAFMTSESDDFWTVTTIYAFVDDIWVALVAPLHEERLVGFAEVAVANVTAG